MLLKAITNPQAICMRDQLVAQANARVEGAG